MLYLEKGSMMMAENNYEQEAKFYIANLPALAEKLVGLGARLIHPRVFETNLRFDLSDGSLAANRQVLRLRRDERARMTFKGPMEAGKEVSTREEIEFEVSSFENAWALLEALGYRVSVMYEKYRATYELNRCEVTLDEMPYGNFIEIEGPDSDAIQLTARQLGLKWDARSQESYLMLFNRLRQGGLQAENLSFKEVNRHYPPEAFRLKAADA
jgi:adenylate cyclase, class 2